MALAVTRRGHNPNTKCRVCRCRIVKGHSAYRVLFSVADEVHDTGPYCSKHADQEMKVAGVESNPKKILVEA